MLVPWYLMASFLYYCRDEIVISDALYDEICGALDREWDEIDHPHKKLVRRSILSAGTGNHLRENRYPIRTRSAAMDILQHLRDGTIDEVFPPPARVRTRTRPQGEPVVRVRTRPGVRHRTRPAQTC